MKRALRVLIAMAGLVAAASCLSDQAPPTAPAVTPLSADLLGGTLTTLGSTTKKLTGTLLSCQPLPYASDDEMVGPGGGTLHIGPHTLRIPAGALSQPVRIFGDAPSDTNRTVRFYPEGLQFARPASLTISYQGCSLVTGLLPQVAYVSDALLILEYEPSTNDLFQQTVTGQVNHFSRYAAAW
jgi:hypothetical protein